MIVASLLAATAFSLPSCGLGTAKAQLKSLRVVVPAAQSISSERYRVDPAFADRVVCITFPRRHVKLMAVTITSGFGTAGVINWVVFASKARGYRVVLVRGGYRLGLTRLGSDIVETEPVYRTADQNCCPTGGFDHTRWRWNGARLEVVRRWHDSSYKP